MARVGSTTLLLLLGTACGGKSEEAVQPVEVTQVCPPSDKVRPDPGDANSDGSVDVADVLFLRDALVNDGASPPCESAADTFADGKLELDDAHSVLFYLFEGAWTMPDSADCPTRTAPPERPCTSLGFRADGRKGGATIALVAPDLQVEAWSLSVAATGCTITGATTAGTDAASRYDPAPGHRKRGYDATFLSKGGAVSTVVLDLLDPVALPKGGGTVLSLDLDAPSCACTLTLDASQKGLGRKVPTVIGAGGARYESPVVTLDVDPC